MIENQIADAEAAIEKERRDFRRRKEQRLKALGASQPSSKPESTVGEPASLRDANDHDPAPVPKVTHEKDHDENGDVMVEAEEDTVIY